MDHRRSKASGHALKFPFVVTLFWLRFARMESHELLREVFQTTSAKTVASSMNLSLSMIYKWAEAPDSAATATGIGSGAVNPLDRVEALFRCTNDPRLIQWLCERGGGFFIKNPKQHHAHPHVLIPATNQIVQEFADMLAVIAQAAGDNSISRKEAKEIRARWEELKSVTESFVHCCEEGNFGPMKQSASTGMAVESQTPVQRR